MSRLERVKKRLVGEGMSITEATHAALHEVYGRKPVTEKGSDAMNVPAVRNETSAVAVPGMTADQVDLLKRTIAKGASDDELKLFLHIANRTGLDPFAKQLHAVKRWDKTLGREVMSVQTGIDGYRLIAERTGKYAPGDEPSFVEDAKGNVVKATAFVKKRTDDGTWHVVAASAYYAEYAQTTRDGKPTRFWAQMPHVMLAKVAEALALRRAFPMELAGIYTTDEMAHAEEVEPRERPARAARALAPETINGEQLTQLREAATNAGHTRHAVLRWLKVGKLTEVLASDFERIKARLSEPAPLDGDAAVAAGAPNDPAPITVEATVTGDLDPAQASEL